MLQTERELADAFIARLDAALKCTVSAATDGAQLGQGHIFVAADPASHAIVEAGNPPRLRLLEREPVEGARPSANLLYGTIARAAIVAVGAVLTGLGEDGAKGLKLLRDAGSPTFVQSRSEATVSQAPDAVVALGAAEEELPLGELAAAVLKCCSTT